MQFIINSFQRFCFNLIVKFSHYIAYITKIFVKSKRVKCLCESDLQGLQRNHSLSPTRAYAWNDLSMRILYFTSGWQRAVTCRVCPSRSSVCIGSRLCTRAFVHRQYPDKSAPTRGACLASLRFPRYALRIYLFFRANARIISLHDETYGYLISIILP